MFVRSMPRDAFCIHLKILSNVTIEMVLSSSSHPCKRRSSRDKRNLQTPTFDTSTGSAAIRICEKSARIMREQDCGRFLQL